MTLLIPIILIATCISILLRPLLSPLRKVPTAHWSSRFSPLWILWHRWSGTELDVLLEAHRKHGPIVLVGPNDLSVASYQDGIRKVYDAGFSKPEEFFSVFNYYGTRNAFTSLERTEHGIRRRRTASLYAKSAVMQSAHLRAMTESVFYERLIPKLEAAVKGNGRIDGLDLAYRICVDFLSGWLFGQCNGTNFLMPPAGEKMGTGIDGLAQWRFHYENTISCREAFFVQEMPGLYKLLNAIGVDLLPRSYGESKEFLESWMAQMADDAERTIAWTKSTGLPLAAKDEPVVYETAKNAVRKDSPHLSEEEQRMQVASEMFDHISAAREVLGLVLGYAFWYLAQHPTAQHRIAAELKEHNINTSSSSPTPSSTDDNAGSNGATQLDALPYLNAVINECLRMRPTSTPLPRITPPDKPVSIAGIDNIPPNTRINSFQWFVHRDPSKWADVDTFEPERWLHREKNNKEGREDVLWPFTSGPRMCLGNHLTYYAMKHVLAVVGERFVLEALPREEGRCWPGSVGDEVPIRVSLRE
ncbi:cytochrome P450 [Aspergillus multicolor]|uniref:cytochrome P450 n=1 Tax=Aspergillus multicolor TaxID=41759 RepID=UPI003CCDFDCC